MLVVNPRATPEVMAIASVAMEKIVHDIEGRAKLKAPVDTGYLQNSIRSSRVGPTSWKIEAGAEYAAHVEYGTRFQAAQPYLRPALDEIRAQLAGGIPS